MKWCNVVNEKGKSYLRTYSMKQSPSWKANRFEIVKKFSAFYGNQRFITTFTSAATSPYPKPDQSSTCPPSNFLKIHLNIVPSMTRSSKWSLSLMFPHQNPVHTSSLPHTCYLARPSHSSQFDPPNNIWCGTQVTKLLTMSFSPLPCYLDPLRPKYFPQRPILKHPQPPKFRTHTKQQAKL
jgi:hypothetical protein